MSTGTLVVGQELFNVYRLADVAPPDLPYSLRIVLENLLRHEDARRVTADQIRALLDWGSPASFAHAVDLHPARVFLHDTNGVPALADLAAMRDIVAGVNPSIPAELVIDHSIVADVSGVPSSYARNVAYEYERNAERYRFLKWGQQALRGLVVVPPGRGIMHQINVEHLARVVMVEDGWAFPDLCLGTDSHTTMVNGLGVLGWGIGGIEAEAALVGQPISVLIPPVVGVRLHGALPPGATATDLVLTIAERLRRHGVVGKFVEFSGPGVTEITVPDRVTIANMSPEFGSTCAYFPIDAETVRYLRFTGRPPRVTALVEAYAKEQGLWHDPAAPPRYTETVDLDLSAVVPSLAGPRRPHDRVPLDRAKASFRSVVNLRSSPAGIGQGSVVIAAITSCTNTSNPTVMVGAALLARNAVTRGLRTKPWVKTSLSPGSRVVTDYYSRAGLTPYLDALGFHLTGYGCMTCIGASGPLLPEVTEAVREHDLAVAAVLSGNRNFDGRINPDVRLNYLASPPLVIAYALAGTMDIDLTTEPLGTGPDGGPVYLRDLWPTPREIQDVIDATLDPAMFARAYTDIFTGDDRWRSLDAPAGARFAWDDNSTYLRRPPFLDDLTPEPPPVADITGACVLVKLGDSVTTDHISPAGAIPPSSPAGEYLRGLGVEPSDLNTYASRRGNHEVMARGTFANVRLRNHLVAGTEGGYTLHNGLTVTVYDAAMATHGPLLVLAGKDYGAGSSRDWAAKGPALLGVRAVLAESFERIHRANLIGMGILPLQFLAGDSADRLGLTGHETFTITGLPAETVTVHTGSASFRARARLDTPREAEYYRHGGVIPYVVRQLLRPR